MPGNHLLLINKCYVLASCKGKRSSPSLPSPPKYSLNWPLPRPIQSRSHDVRPCVCLCVCVSVPSPVRVCPFESVSVRFFLLLSVSVPFCPFLSVWGFFFYIGATIHTHQEFSVSHIRNFFMLDNLRKEVTPWPPPPPDFCYILSCFAHMERFCGLP